MDLEKGLRGDLAAVKQLLADIVSQMTRTASGEDFDMEVSEIQASVVNEELLKYSNKETVTKKNKSGFDPLHIAASQGHHGIVQLQKGHTAVVNELLSRDGGLLESTRSNGKNALHLAARQGHVDVVQALLSKDPQLARRTDKKGQTALQMAVKGQSCEIVDVLLSLPDMNVNALTRDHKTALYIAEGLPPSAESAEIKSCLSRKGALRANELNQPRDELRQTESIKPRILFVVAVLFATVAFAAIFTLPGGDQDSGVAVVVSSSSFKIFFIFNAIALFTSLAVVVVQITLVRVLVAGGMSFSPQADVQGTERRYFINDASFHMLKISELEYNSRFPGVNTGKHCISSHPRISFDQHCRKLTHSVGLESNLNTIRDFLELILVNTASALIRGFRSISIVVN
ncbi:Ankyrin repeat-containing protein [Hibiscus syriacus]|uniref:Ankyrin repeat-containing protein n=1 Tax=Hibiscus syriacus TaxID=106335 RepID=A0A6A2WDW2_HIBSY|nr:Ankyrin repeat-containing protein [Hibiscus syriacus]